MSSAIIATGFFSWWQGRQSIRKLAQGSVELNRRVGAHLNAHLGDPLRLTLLNVQEYNDGHINPQNFRRIGRLFWQQMQLFDVGYLNFGTPQGGFIGVERIDGGRFIYYESIPATKNQRLFAYEIDRNGNIGRLLNIRPNDLFAEPWYMAAVKARKLVWSEVYSWADQPQKLSITVSKPIYDSQGRLVGVLGSDQILRQTSAFLRNLNLTDHGRVFILQPSGHLFASSHGQVYEIEPSSGKAVQILGRNSRDPLIRIAAEQTMAINSQSEDDQIQQREFQSEGETYFVNISRWQDDAGLTLWAVVVFPERAFTSPLDIITTYTLLLSLLSPVVVVVVSWWLSRWLSQAIRDIHRAASELTQGRWDYRVPPSVTVEFTALADTFNTMAEQLEESFILLEHHAYRDALTNLPNRAAFADELKAEIQKMKQDPSCRFAVLFLDVDSFKLVNDSLGHIAGDQLLIEMARRMTQILDSSHLLARFGGDEFTILLRQIADVTTATRVADQIQSTLRQPFVINSNECFVSASVGIVLSTLDHDEPDGFLRDADIAMYQAKAEGKSRYEVFDTQMHEQTRDRLLLETELRRAVERAEFEVYYQPIFHLLSQRVVGFEALVRWHHPRLGFVPPGRFIAIAEETGLIVPIGRYVLWQAAYQLYCWQMEFSSARSMTMSVNLSPKQFIQPDLPEQIDRVLGETGLPPQNLCLEITESAMMNNAELNKAKLLRLQSKGIKISIDDFGTGYSSLSYLHNFPIDTLKVDRSFVCRITEQGEHMEIVETIISLAHHLHMDVNAEGVEYDYQVEYLRSLGCEKIQGYWVSKPQSANLIRDRFLLNNAPVTQPSS
ncbi:MAG: EAL domain-containing protein [Oscillatoriales cyanobacterium SM2_2_1]|nr:EAL domain-containing protein [Oscillatoriales cyanobacterium SM2_2_1]